MPTLLEVERAICRSLAANDDAACAELIVSDAIPGEARLDTYRNTFLGTLTTALRLAFPAIHRLVGAEFFDSAARLFIAVEPPRSAWLDDYGAGFPEFLAGFAPASLPYLPGVARLERAVNRALHAPDAKPLDLSRLAEIDPTDHGRITFAPHPSVSLVRAEHPVDAIWRAVLAQDDAAMVVIDPAAGAVWLLVERRATGIEVTRLTEPQWRFAAELCASRPLQAAIDAAPEIEAASLLAGHLAAGRVVGFALPT
jgi:hypothetical protein